MSRDVAQCPDLLAGQRGMPPTSTQVHSRSNSWLDGWLDQGSFQGQVTIEFRGVDGNLFEMRLGGQVDNLHDDLVTNRPVAIREPGKDCIEKVSFELGEFVV
jgi:hypothetical protein